MHQLDTRQKGLDLLSWQASWAPRLVIIMHQRRWRDDRLIESASSRRAVLSTPLNASPAAVVSIGVTEMPEMSHLSLLHQQ
jgi:hypothetical protein